MNEPQPDEQASFKQDVIDALVADFKALDILSADVDDEVNVRAEVARRAEVRDRFDQTDNPRRRRSGSALRRSP